MNIDVKKKIENCLRTFSQGSLTRNALNLFATLGYNTSRQNPFVQKTYQTFKESFLDGDTRFNEDRALVKEWQSVDLLFQLSKDEMAPQHGLFDTQKVDQTIIETYLFFVIELAQTEYSRTALAQIIREINKVFPMPVMVLFKYGTLLTLAVIDRRLHKRDERKDVLEKITLIKDISIENPHRAHVEILFDLSYDELLRKRKFTNFVELHNAWQKTLDTKELNKRFFKELANWYFYSQGFVSFPRDKRNTDGKNIQLNLIRLITRLIFVWFLKEKKLIKAELFDNSFLKQVVKNFDPGSETAKNFYPAILQNLFFATLNQHMKKRDFARDDDKFNKDDQGVKSLYRYADRFIISKKEIIELFKDIPFLNGGLFDCLDRFDEEKLTTGIKDQIFIDGFTRIEKNVPVVPDFLFFGSKDNIDLTNFYGDKKRQKEQFKGLIRIFDDYKFTIEENTPIEEEIALDPELLGKAFENLLAYYTPETETTARKQTGSFYTPREIVNYMVDESLVAYLKTQMLTVNPAYVEFGKSQIKLFGNEATKKQLAFTETINKSRWQGKEQELENALRRMIHYNNDPHPFSEPEVLQLIFAIDHCKILDPACGSGAFPMGMLHKLVYLLGKLDPEDETGNTRWRALQKRKAEIAISIALNEKDKQQREQKLIEINDIFENNASDYGRKLYLIESCIYGVDIQPIAVQISKLRFFISLVVDQSEKSGTENRGIRPLPNLETKFVAANTLIGLEKPAQLPIGYEAISLLQKQLQDIRHQHFEAKTRKKKLHCQKEDKQIRKQISDELIALGFPNNDASKIASFDIYDQNAAADWFEPEWMFGSDLKKGFDVVIGNPPYGADLSAGDIKYFKTKYILKSSESAILFTEKGHNLAKLCGIITYIIPKSFTFASNYEAARNYALEYLTFIVDCGKAFDNVLLEANVFLINKAQPSKHYNSIQLKYNDFILLATIDKKLVNKYGLLLNGVTNTEILIANRLTSNSLYLNDIAVNRRGTILLSLLKKGKYAVIGGKEIDRFGFRSVRGYINDDLHGTASEINANSILLQGIVAHIENPVEHIKITACIPDHRMVFIADNLNQITLADNSIYTSCFIRAILNSTIINWYAYYFIYGKGIRTLRIDNPVTKRIPLPHAHKVSINIFDHFSSYSIFSHSQREEGYRYFFERLIDAMVYELYFPDEIKAAAADVLKHLTHLPELKADWSDAQKLKVIEKVYREFSNPAHPVATAMERQKAVPEVRIIEGLP